MVDKIISNGRNSVVREIWDWYARQLSANGQSEFSVLEWYYDRFDNGEKISSEMRILYRSRPDLQAHFMNPFDTRSDDGGFYRWWKYTYPG